MKRSTDRLAHFMKEVEKHNLPLDKLQIFEAIDASIHNFTPEELELTKHMRHEPKPVICNFLSHYYVWQDAAKYGKVLVLQDDVYFVDNFMQKLMKVCDSFPDDAVLVNIGNHLVARGSH